MMSPIWAVLDWMQEQMTVILIVWMLINASGLRDACILLGIGLRRRRAGISRGLDPKGPRVRLANRGIREMIIRTVFHGVGLVIGIMVILDLPTLNSSGWLVVGMALLMAVASRFDLSDDRKMGSILLQEVSEHSLIPRLRQRTTEKAPTAPSEAQEGS